MRGVQWCFKCIQILRGIQYHHNFLHILIWTTSILCSTINPFSNEGGIYFHSQLEIKIMAWIWCNCSNAILRICEIRGLSPWLWSVLHVRDLRLPRQWLEVKYGCHIKIIILSSSNNHDRLCGLVVRIPGFWSRGQGSIPGATRFSEK
jgi:uncharacterized membrane protein YjgN (DUF898 family)